MPSLLFAAPAALRSAAGARAAPALCRRRVAPARVAPPLPPPPPAPLRATRRPRAAAHTPAPRPRAPRRGLARALAGAGAAGGVAAAVALAPRLLRAYGALAGLHPLAGAAVVALGNFVCVTCCFPANMGLMISAGAALGARNAFAALYLSKVAAACVTFLLARGVFYERAKRRLDAVPKLARVLARSKDGGWRMVLTMRLSPFPGFLLNYLLSVMGVGFWDYLVGTAVGILPSIANLAMIGAAGREVAVGASGGGVSWLPLGLKACMILSTLIVMSFVTREVRKAFVEDDAAPAAPPAEI